MGAPKFQQEQKSFSELLPTMPKYLQDIVVDALGDDPDALTRRWPLASPATKKISKPIRRKGQIGTAN